jgi:hypothetical protein
MTFNDWLAVFVIGGITVFCLTMLWVIVRFAIISPMRTRGAGGRMRKPQPEAVEKKWRVKLPPALAKLYREHPAVERSEFYLAPDISNRDRWLYIYSFIPLTVVDISEAKRSSAVPGVPIALENKGTYYLPSSALRGDEPVPVMLRMHKKDQQVAASVEEFFGYTATEWPDDEENAAS